MHRNPWIAVSRIHTPATGTDNWQTIRQTSGQVELTAPFVEDTYEVRFYQGGYDLVESATISFSVANAAQLSLDKTTYTMGEKIIVTYSGVTEAQLHRSPMIAVWRANTPVSTIDNRQYLTQTSGRVELTAPKQDPLKGCGKS